MKEWITVLKAADAAVRWHMHQKRKGAAPEPYINHLLEVASLVAEATHGSDPNLVVAALLHDAMEDQEVPREMIAEVFGQDVPPWWRSARTTSRWIRRSGSAFRWSMHLTSRLGPR